MENPSLEEILKGPFEEIARIAEEHRTALRKRDYKRIREIAHMHVLKLKLMEQYEDFFQNIIIESIREELGKGTIDGLALRMLREHPDEIPSFEQYKRDKITAKTIYGNAELFEVYSVLSEESTAKTFVTHFSDSERYKRACEAYRFINHIKQGIEQDYDEKGNPDHEFLQDIMKRLRPVKPKYSQKNTLAVTFINSLDMHDEAIAEYPDIDERTEYLGEVSDINIALAVFGDKYRGFLKKGRLNSLWGKESLSDIDHAKVFVDKFYGRLGIDIPDKFHRTMKNRVFDVINEEKKRFTKGDSIPTNIMVQHGDSAGVMDSRSSRIYSLVDNEFACLDAVQSSLVQLWTKFNIFDYKGDSLLMKDRREAEEVLLNKSYDVFVRMLKTAGFEHEAKGCSEQRFNDIYSLLKIENYFLWAARYYSFQDLDIKNPEDSLENARYYYTLAVREMAKQGIISDEDDDILGPLNEVFGQPLRASSQNKDEITLESVAGRFEPHERTVSFFKPVKDMLDAEKELEQITQDYIKKMRYRGALKTMLISGAALGAAIAAGEGGLLFNEYLKKEQAERERMLSLTIRYYDTMIRPHFESYMDAIQNGRHKGSTRYVDEDFVRQEAREQGVSETLVLKIITANDRHNPYKDLGEYNGVVILDRSRIEPNENDHLDSYDLDFQKHVREDIASLKKTLTAHGLDPSEFPQVENKRKREKLENALFDYLAPEAMKKELDRWGGGLNWKENWRELAQYSSIKQDIDVIIKGPLDAAMRHQYRRWGEEKR